MRKKIFYLLSLILVFYVGLFRLQEREKPLISPIVLSASPLLSPTPDIRIKKLEKFFDSYHSPLASASADFIEISDLYGLDYRLLVAIAGVESSFETRGNIHDFNPFGLLCTHSSPCASFRDYRDAIQTLAGTLKNHRAYTEFRETGKIEKLAKRYLAGDKEKWVKTVKFFIKKL